MAIDEAALLGPAEFIAGVTDENGTTVVTLVGELDLFSAGELREVLVLPEVLDAPIVRVDVSKVEFLGSTCVGLLVSACKRIRASGGTFSVNCGRSQVRRVLELSGLVDYLELEDGS
jgi:anti-sigma B factor antagonist